MEGGGSRSPLQYPKWFKGFRFIRQCHKIHACTHSNEHLHPALVAGASVANCMAFVSGGGRDDALE